MVFAAVAYVFSVAFALFASDALEVFHFGGRDWRANECNMVQLCNFATAVIVLDKNLDVLYVLEFHVAQIDQIAGQIFWINPVELYMEQKRNRMSQDKSKFFNQIDRIDGQMFQSASYWPLTQDPECMLAARLDRSQWYAVD